jgi:hypothetical protein
MPATVGPWHDHYFGERRRRHDPQCYAGNDGSYMPTVTVLVHNRVAIAQASPPQRRGCKA